MLLKTETVEYRIEKIWPKAMTIDANYIRQSKEKLKAEFGFNHNKPDPNMHCVKCDKMFEVGDKVRIVFFADKSLLNRLACESCSDEISEYLKKDM